MTQRAVKLNSSKDKGEKQWSVPSSDGKQPLSFINAQTAVTYPWQEPEDMSLKTIHWVKYREINLGGTI